MSEYSYYYLNKLLDTIYKVHYKYNIPYELPIIRFTSNAGNQAELKGTFYYPLKDRVDFHKAYLSKLWKEREKKSIKQLKLNLWQR